MTSNKNNLFIIYIGGSHTKSYIELHDIRFVIANTIEDTYDSLRQSWWGIPSSLHIDACGILNYVDGYEVHIKDIPQLNQRQKLYFVNLGGYDKEQFTELHKNVFVLAENESKAKVKALKQILNWDSHHKDYQFELERVIDVHNILQRDNLFLHLIKSEKETKFEFTCKYISIGK
jgi:hypothetical protein